MDDVLIQSNRHYRLTVRNSESNEQIEKQKVDFVPLGTQFELAPFWCFISNVIRVGPFLTICCVTRTPSLDEIICKKNPWSLRLALAFYSKESTSFGGTKSKKK